MQNFCLCFVAMLVAFLPTVSRAESKGDAAYKNVMEHLCDKGYKYAMAEYSIGVCVFDCPYNGRGELCGPTSMRPGLVSRTFLESKCI